MTFAILLAVSLFFFISGMLVRADIAPRNWAGACIGSGFEASCRQGCVAKQQLCKEMAVAQMISKNSLRRVNCLYSWSVKIA